jgi:hypothetical protein
VGTADDLIDTGMIYPACLIRPTTAQSDPEHNEEPDYLQQNFEMTIIAKVHGGRTSENPIIGAYRESTTTSAGRGILELEEELFNAVEKLNTVDGVVIQHTATGASLTELIADEMAIVYRDYQFTAWLTADRYYHPGREFSATGGSGSASLTWSLPPDRYDRYRMRLVRKSGAVAPTSVTDGTELTLSTNLATSHTDTVAAGTYSYSLFASYDELRDPVSSDDRTSDAVTQTSVVVS